LGVQPDGKIVIGGQFTAVNGTSRNYIARLNADGTLDNSFNSGSGPDNAIVSLALQPDGKLLIGGFFSSVNGIPRNRIARLNTNGSLDTSFDAGSVAAGTSVRSIALQSDGKVLIGGEFAKAIARLNVDGSLDTSFNPGTGANNQVRSIAVQSDGKVLIGGHFTFINGAARNYIAR